MSTMAEFDPAPRPQASVEPPLRHSRPWTGTRIAGFCLVALWAAIILGMAAYMISAYNADLVDRYAGKYLSGLLTTIKLVSLSLLIGAILSIPVAWARTSTNKIIGAFAYAYVYFFRGTPLIAQVFLIYYGLGSFRPQLESVGLWNFFKDAWNCGLVAFSLNTAAYQAEILRGAVQSLPKGQWEAAASLGLPRWVTLFKVILPQSMIVALRPYGNEIILMIKGSAIVAIITVYDLMGETRRAYAQTFDFQTYLYAALIYLGVVELLRHVIEWVERRITKHLKR